VQPPPLRGFRAHRGPNVAALVDERLRGAPFEPLEPTAVFDLLPRHPDGRGRGRTTRLETPAGPLLLRGVVRGGLLAPLLGDAIPGPGRPLREVRVTATLAAAGAPVVRPALALALRRFGPVWRGLVATWLEEGVRDGIDFLTGSPPPALRTAVCAAAGRAVRRFHDAGGVHADLHLGNLLVRATGQTPEVILCDLDRARMARAVPTRRRSRELARLYRSLLRRGLQDRLSDADLEAFAQAYIAGDSALARALARNRRARALGVAFHALRYRGPPDAGRPPSRPSGP